MSGVKGKSGVYKHSPQCGFQKGHSISKGKNNPMYGIHRFGKNSPYWKGGIRRSKNWYTMIYAPNHPFHCKSNYVYEHRLVMEKVLGRYLKPNEVVHHINKNLSDNRICNLILFPNKSAHSKFHKEKTHQRS